VSENPLAFPLPGLTLSSGVGYPSNPGMTLRDWFAGQALPAIIAATSAGQHQPGVRSSGMTIAQAMAGDAYDLADAMLAARSKP